MKKKLLVTAMAAMPMLGMFGGDYASATVTKEDAFTQNTTEDVQVKLNQSSTFSVIIPKKIEQQVNTSAYTDNYTVVVEGNIAGNETVTVIPDAEFDLAQSGKSNITAKVTQNGQTASYNDLANGARKSLNGTVTANNVTAGSWEGIFRFDISLDKVNP